MNISNVIFVVVLIAAAIAGVYWYQTDGHKMYEDFRRSDNKPFFLDQYDW